VNANTARFELLRGHPERSLVPRVSWRGAAGALLFVCLLCASTASAQDVTEPSLKAAFIYNFAKFTEWPLDALPATGSFTACVLGDASVTDALERTVRGRLLSGRTISVSRVTLDGPLRACHLLYVSGVTAAQVSALVVMVKGAPVLTISDIEDFTPLGGIAHVFVENGRMRFELNLERAKLSRLQLSSKLLTLASRVHDAQGTLPR
jgi:hypothetical protein